MAHPFYLDEHRGITAWHRRYRHGRECSPGIVEVWWGNPPLRPRYKLLITFSGPLRRTRALLWIRANTHHLTKGPKS